MPVEGSPRTRAFGEFLEPTEEADMAQQNRVTAQPNRVWICIKNQHRESRVIVNAATGKQTCFVCGSDVLNPTEMLNAIRDLIGFLEMDTDVDYSDLTDTFRAFDNWLSHNGVLPEQWVAI
jgi:hypothetical protein